MIDRNAPPTRPDGTPEPDPELVYGQNPDHRRPDEPGRLVSDGILTGGIGEIIMKGEPEARAGAG